MFTPMCSNYHAGEPYLQPRGKGKGPIAVHNASHMVHVDAPETVARELLELVALSSHVIAQDEKHKSKSKI
jgi:pimeloyl-ACP methyl ester carboxylesterase